MRINGWILCTFVTNFEWLDATVSAIWRSWPRIVNHVVMQFVAHMQPFAGRSHSLIERLNLELEDVHVSIPLV